MQGSPPLRAASLPGPLGRALQQLGAGCRSVMLGTKIPVIFFSVITSRGASTRLSEVSRLLTGCKCRGEGGRSPNPLGRAGTHSGFLREDLPLPRWGQHSWAPELGGWEKKHKSVTTNNPGWLRLGCWGIKADPTSKPIPSRGSATPAGWKCKGSPGCSGVLPSLCMCCAGGISPQLPWLAAFRLITDASGQRAACFQDRQAFLPSPHRPGSKIFFAPSSPHRAGCNILFAPP